MRTHDKIEQQDPSTIRRMFDAIAPTYDFLNHLLSFGFDIRWRRKAVALLSEKRGGTFLDIAAGSGGVTLELLRLQPSQVVAADFTLSMLKVLQHKLEGVINADRVDIVFCDALRMPFRDRMFDGTIVAFGIRNFADRLLSLQEMVRVLKPNGISIILELSKPRQPIISRLHNLYTHTLLPAMAKIISKHTSAYQYLPESITSFPDQEEFLSLMMKAGFRETKAYPLTFGAATIYFGRK
jgi:demethylmenaquinone methyltransferase / 2-methoxy-6-polyprenyl-1,4-benzoquinol methylase